MDKQRLQLDEKGNLRHFLTIEGLNRAMLVELLDTAAWRSPPWV